MWMTNNCYKCRREENNYYLEEVVSGHVPGLNEPSWDKGVALAGPFL
jgi:hypothetical protein